LHILQPIEVAIYPFTQALEMLRPIACYSDSLTEDLIRRINLMNADKKEDQVSMPHGTIIDKSWVDYVQELLSEFKHSVNGLTQPDIQFFKILITEKPLTHLLMHQEAELDFILNRFHILAHKENATKHFRKWHKKKQKLLKLEI
jgi:hypothetical protein